MVLALLLGCGSTDSTPTDTINDTGAIVDTTDTDDAGAETELPVLPVEPAVPDPGSVTALAGDADRGHSDGPANLARFQGVTALCLGEALYVSDTFAGTVRKVELATGTTSTLAGSAGRFGLSDGLAKDARFASPRGLACLPDGVLVADSGALRKIGADGQTITVAGFPGTPGNIDGSSANARIGYLIHAMATHPDGRVFFTDRSNDALRVVDPADWSVATVSGALDGPGGLAIDPERPERVVVADTFSDRIVTVDLATGALTALPLTPAPDTPQALALFGDDLWVAGFGAELWRYRMGSGRGAKVDVAFPGTFASMVHVPGTGESGARLIYAALAPEALRQVTLSDSRDLLLAGPEVPSAHRDGPVEVAKFGLINGVAAFGPTLFIADSFGLRRLRDGTLDTLTTEALFDDGDEKKATPVSAVHADPAAGKLWVSVPESGRVVALDLEAAAFFGLAPPAIDSFEGLAQPVGLAVTDAGLIVAERGANRLALLSVERTTFAGDGLRGTVDGPLLSARFDAPYALAWDAARGRLWVGQASGHLRVLDDGEVTTVLRPGGEGGSSDGLIAEARLGLPLGLVAGHDLFILDADPGALRRVVFDGDEPARLETLVGGLLGGGLPYPLVAPLDEAILGGAAAGVSVGGDLLVAGEYAIYRVDLGDRLTPGGGQNGPDPEQCDFAVRLGTGETSFQPLPETLILERGGQGLQHVFLSLEAAPSHVDAGFHTTTAALYASGETAPRARMSLTLPWTVGEVGQVARATGILFVIEDPSRVVDTALDLIVTVATARGLGCARAAVRIR